MYRSYIYPTQSSGFIKRLSNYFSFVFSSFVTGLFLPKTDFIFTESPPLFLGLSGYWLSRIKKSRWIFNVADLWPASVVELGIIRQGSLTHWLSRNMESFFYRKAAVVTGQSKTILEDIRARFPEIQTYHLSNGVDPTPYQIGPKINSNKITVMYTGLHGLAQGLDQIIDAAKLLEEDHPEIEFKLVGDGPEKSTLKKKAQELNLRNITFLDPIPKTEIPNLLTSADMLIVPLKIQLTGAVPSKLYEGMAVAKPIILIAGNEAAEIVNNADCGVVIAPGDTKALTYAITQLARDETLRIRMGQNGRKVVMEKYDRRRITKAFSQFLITLK